MLSRTTFRSTISSTLRINLSSHLFVFLNQSWDPAQSLSYSVVSTCEISSSLRCRTLQEVSSSSQKSKKLVLGAKISSNQAKKLSATIAQQESRISTSSESRSSNSTRRSIAISGSSASAVRDLFTRIFYAKAETVRFSTVAPKPKSNWRRFKLQ